MPTGILIDSPFWTGDIVSSDLASGSFDFEITSCFDSPNFISGRSPDAMVLPETQNYGAEGYHINSFKQDFYYRVYVSPSLIELGTIASSQTRTIEVWNAWPESSAILYEVQINDPIGIQIDGPSTPLSLNPLEQTSYTITIDSLGPPSINVEMVFDFTNVPNPRPVIILGQRAIRFDIIPDGSVKETWQWLTDLIVANDGSEQRIALRGTMPRVIQNFRVLFTKLDAINKFWSDMLTAAHTFWVPEWQYSTMLTQGSLSGSSRLYYDPNLTDIRSGEYTILIQRSGASVLVQVASLNVDGCNLATPLLSSIPAGTYISPGSISLMKDESGQTRGAVDHYGKTNLEALSQRRRSTLARPGTSSPLNSWNGRPVLEAHPMADEDIEESVKYDIEIYDNNIGEIKQFKLWEYPRSTMSRQYRVSRTPITSCPDLFTRDLDYWKWFFDYTRGPQKTFWASTWRNDLTRLTNPLAGGNTFIAREIEYSQKVWPNLPTHRFLEFDTEGGFWRVTVMAALEESGGSRILFTPPLPNNASYEKIRRISFILPCRIESDSVEFEHLATHSLLKFNIRTAET